MTHVRKNLLKSCPARRYNMQNATHTIIVSTPEELMPMIMEAVRAVEERKADDVSPQGKRLLSPKDVEHEFGMALGRHRPGVHHIRQTHPL